MIDIELLTDNALAAVNYRQAARNGVKYILAGTNSSTEGIPMPPGWVWFKGDKTQIYDLWKRFGDGRRLTTFPAWGSLALTYHTVLRRIHWVSFWTTATITNRPRWTC